MTSSPWITSLQSAAHAASRGEFDRVAELCRGITSAHNKNVAALLDAGSLLLDCGLLAAAKNCFDDATVLEPTDYRPFANLANLALIEGRHSDSRKLFQRLLQARPNDPLLWRNALTSLEYDLEADDAERLTMARSWGQWAESRVGGRLPRPVPRRNRGGPLKVGYVSADFCQHTVGLFVKNVLSAHDPLKVEAYAYSAGPVNDWVTKAICSAVNFRDVKQMDDATLARKIEEDQIDLLVDLSGHTAGSRLTAFAYRPAPVQVSWLGYFATTGLNCMDAVLLDDWHAPPGSEALFSESVVRLPAGRLFYSPVPFAPDVAPPPAERCGYITFGSFNNTSKLNPRVLKLWASLLSDIPNSRLILKWRNFNDPDFRARIWKIFLECGIESSRVELRGPSFHAELLKEYGEIDIALDPFPFTGALTSCEALWMGVPVVTWPQKRAVSRQTHALLSAIDLDELSAQDADEFKRIALGLANDLPRLKLLRNSLRERMRNSSLCRADDYCRGLELCYQDLFNSIAEKEAETN